MTFCSKCGLQISDDANFCPRCGTLTQTGKSANVKFHSDELREVGIELEKAFTTAAQEIRQAFQKKESNKNSDDAQTKAIITCQKCEAKNEAGAIFCYSCGNKLQP